MERRLFYLRLKFAFLGSLRQDLGSNTTLTICDYFNSQNLVYQEPLRQPKKLYGTWYKNQ